MIGATTTVQVDTRPIRQATERATFNNLRHAGFAISRDAKQSIVTSDEPSRPGEPPHTRAQRGHNIRGAIFVDAEPESAVIGPRYSIVGDVGEAHEFGKARRGEPFDKRPFMRPALDRNIDRFAQGWSGSIGE